METGLAIGLVVGLVVVPVVVKVRKTAGALVVKEMNFANCC